MVKSDDIERSELPHECSEKKAEFMVNYKK